jgi:tRNA(Arg) A34 adenosine deaminase TadA
MWDSLLPPWQATMELVWEAYCDNCIPIAAIITNTDGVILARGRNRIRGRRTNMRGFRPGNKLAHAEVEALNNLDYDHVDRHSCILYTSTEPCPMCMGAFYMSGLRTLHYASRDPYAGSVNLLGKTPYLSVKPIKVIGPCSPILECILMAFYIEKELHDLNGKAQGHVVFEVWKQIVPKGVKLGKALFQTGTLRHMRGAGLSVPEVIDALANQVQ